jgi:hypothetical protein
VAGQIHKPGLGLARDRWLATGARQIIERCYRAMGHGAFDAAVEGLMAHQFKCSLSSRHDLAPLFQIKPGSYRPRQQK